MSMAMATVEADLDYAIALSLQDQFNEEAISQESKQDIPAKEDEKRYDPKRVVDECWELTDPNPNIHDLFVQFDDLFFGSTLKANGVAVSWSGKMTMCAGVCSYEGRGGLCSVRLSQPLLKLRPRRDLVETLLHEMIHAYLFVTENNKDHNAHGPNFRSHMHRINKLTGASISVYHSFHDEVSLYRQHWWKCNGPCQKRHPYYGIVKRAVNRAPSPNDPWWADHKMTCGGTYTKIKEPEDYRKSKKGKDTSTSKGKGTSEKVKFGNIKEIFSAGTTSNATDQSMNPRNTQLFGGKGHHIKAGNTITIDEERADLREKILAAAEKRRHAEDQRGIKRKFEPTSREKYSSDKSEDYSQPSGKKLRLSNTLNANDSVILVDMESLTSNPSAKTAGNKAMVDLTVYEDDSDHSRPMIDLGDGDSNSDCSNSVIDLGDDYQGDSIPVIDLGDDYQGDSIPVIDLGDDYQGDSDASSQSIGNGLQFMMCPVCGRTDIPAAIINSHVAFCLDEDIESRTVDEDHL